LVPGRRGGVRGHDHRLDVQHSRVSVQRHQGIATGLVQRQYVHQCHPVFTYGALVEEFTYDNTFNHAGGTSSITIQGGILTEDSAWQVAGTASRYVIADHFTVGSLWDDAGHCPGVHRHQGEHILQRSLHL
jgi:hypothetical protein